MQKLKMNIKNNMLMWKFMQKHQRKIEIVINSYVQREGEKRREKTETGSTSVNERER